MQKTFYVYIVANKTDGTLYTGVTSDLLKRIYEHKNKLITNAFSNKYNLDKLVYYAAVENINDAIAQEKRLKNWHRKWKTDLIEATNPNWDDLSARFTSQ